jgi:hypothetical protein
MGWRSCEAEPERHACSDGELVRPVEKPVSANGPEGTYVPPANQMLLRIVRGCRVSVVTCASVTWLALYFAARRKLARADWDQPSWRVSQAVQEYITAHNRQAKQQGGCRFTVRRLPSKSPWLKAIEPG